MLSLIVLQLSATASLTEITPDDATASLTPMTVEATKTSIPGADIVAPVTLIDAQRIAAEQVQNIDDLVRYEPGVDVTDQGSRFGLGGFSIRGVGGNRVLIEQDGVPVAGAFSIGSFSNASRDFVDVAALKQVEIVRGPASSLFGSDAVGGVVSFVTKGPYDYLTRNGHFVDIGTGYHSISDTVVTSGTGAWVGGNWSAMVHVTARDGAERDNSLADPLDARQTNVLLKAGYGLPGEGGLELTLDRMRARDVTDVDSREGVQDFSAGFGFPYIISTTQVAGNDRRQRQRVSLGQSFDSGALGADYLRWRAYVQESGTDQDTLEVRSTNIAGTLSDAQRQRQFRFDQRMRGLEVNASSQFMLAETAHRLDYGVEFEVSDTEQLRDGESLDTLTGIVSSQVGPDLFPVRDFPLSRATRLGAYVQDQFAIGPVHIAPGLRYDRFEINPESDAIFAADNPGITPVDLSDGQLSLKLGASWSLSPATQVRAHYVEGFRAPPVNNVNVGFTNLQFGYTAIPNRDLKPESSRGVEIGVNHRTAHWQIRAAVFHTDYQDFIEAFEVVSQDPLTGLLTFQSVNKSDVRIRGAEVTTRWQPAALPAGFSLNASLAYAHGDDRSANAPLNSVAPLNGVLGLDYQAPDARWGLSLVSRAATSPARLDTRNGELLEPGGYVVGDVLAHYAPTQNTRLRLAIYNLTDRQYTRYLDVQGVPATTASAARFVRPGRHASLSFNWTL